MLLELLHYLKKNQTGDPTTTRKRSLMVSSNRNHPMVLRFQVCQLLWLAHWRSINSKTQILTTITLILALLLWMLALHRVASCSGVTYCDMFLEPIACKRAFKALFLASKTSTCLAKHGGILLGISFYFIFTCVCMWRCVFIYIQDHQHGWYMGTCECLCVKTRRKPTVSFPKQHWFSLIQRLSFGLLN